MSLQPGTRLGTYEITNAIGAGGMGEVYRARDTTLNRDVAIKVLPESFAADPERRARFEREAQAVAALSHPNILSIFEFGTHDGQLFVVTELLEGETLRERLEKGALSVRKTIEMAVCVARGLAAAHDKGLVHRDLKPDNIFMLADGQVKILDFGLARQAISTSGADETQTAAVMTDPGTVMGTVGYMAPEQVRGQLVDGRSDLFALGTVLYEALTGQRAFLRETSADTMTAVLTEDPPELGGSRTDISPALDRIIQHCLEKNPKQRFQSAPDVAFALESLSGSGSSTGPVPTAAPRRGPRLVLVASVAVVALAAAVLLGRASVAPSSRGHIEFSRKTFDERRIFNARFAPGGQTIYFSSMAADDLTVDLLVVRPGVPTPESLNLPGTHLLDVSSTGELAVLTGARYSGNHRLFTGTLARMTPGGEPRDWLTDVREADWSPDGSTMAIVRTSGEKDTIEYPIDTVLYTSATGYLSDVRVSPDGSQVAFFEHPGSGDDRGWVQVVDSSERVTTLTTELGALEGLAWAGDNKRLLYSGIPADGSNLEVFSVPVSGTEPSEQALPTSMGTIVFDVADDGTWLVMSEDYRSVVRGRLVDDVDDAERDLGWLDRSGGARLSSDGRSLLFSDQSASAGLAYAVTLRRAGREPVRLGPGSPFGFSPNGEWAGSMSASREDFLLLPVGAGEARPFKTGVTNSVVPPQFLDDEHLMLCGTVGASAPRCYSEAIAGGDPVAITSDGIRSAIVSPDGSRLLAFVGGAATILATGGGPSLPAKGLLSGDNPRRWAADNQSVFARIRPFATSRIRVDRVNVFTGVRTRALEFELPRNAGTQLAGWDIAGDGATYAYTFRESKSRLFTVSGIR